MARLRTQRITLLKEKLIARLRDGFHRPGERFFSNRAIARQFDVSYLTAHRLIQELVAEGWLARRAASGTYVPGPVVEMQGAEFFFHPRARKPGSFGFRLMAELSDALRAAGIAIRTTWASPGAAPRRDWYPVMWECPHFASELGASRRFVLVLNDRPRPGLGASFVDSVSTDDFSGGAAAAECLLKSAAGRQLAVFAGPSDDLRCQQRVAGFQSHARKAAVIWAGSWYADDAMAIAPRLLTRRFQGVFCCNDRLAEALIRTFTAAGRPLPQIVGFDDAPVAERLNLTTIAVPWKEIVSSAANIVRRRLDGDAGVSAQLIFAPRPVIRSGYRSTERRPAAGE